MRNITQLTVCLSLPHPCCLNCVLRLGVLIDEEQFPVSSQGPQVSRANFLSCIAMLADSDMVNEILLIRRYRSRAEDLKENKLKYLSIVAKCVD